MSVAPEPTTVLCYDCFKEVEPLIKKSNKPNWFDSYFCPNCKDKEIARKSNKGDNDFAIWNGREFVRRHKNG